MSRCTTRGLIGARNRFRPGQRPKAYRLYLLTGVITCESGHPMHGECRVARDREWRYYVCRRCRVPSVPADEAERIVVEAVKTMTLPPKAIDEARAELARWLDVPDADLFSAKRRRLETQLARLPSRGAKRGPDRTREDMVARRYQDALTEAEDAPGHDRPLAPAVLRAVQRVAQRQLARELKRAIERRAGAGVGPARCPSTS